MAHGAGAGMLHPFMANLANDLGRRGIATLRYQFPYMEKHGRRPDPPALCHATVRAAVDAARALLPALPLFAGGKSFGGRMTSQAQAANPLPDVRGLAFLGFPLHPPKQPSDSRAAHLLKVQVPMLFLQGARDLYAEPELLNPLITLLADRATLILLPDADHSFHVPARSGFTDSQINDDMINATRGLDRCGSAPVTLLAELVRASQRVGATAARRVKVRELAALLKSLTPDEIDIGVHYLSGEIPPGKNRHRLCGGARGRLHVGRGFGDTVDRRSRRHAGGTRRHSRQPDRLRGAQRPCRNCSRVRRAPEQQFLLRLLIGELRQGALAGVMVDAIAAAAELPVATVRRAAMYSKSLGAVAAAALREGAAALEKFQLELFSPVSPMLAQTAADVAEALQEIHGAAAFEWKMDGARIQVHKLGDDVRIYTRSLNEITAAIPEIAELARTFAGTHSGARRRGDCLRCGGPAASLPGDHAALRPQAQRRSLAQHIADRSVLLRLPALWRAEHRGAHARRSVSSP